MSLTLKQERFIDSYLANGGRAKDAAVEAGYAEASG
jgi:phage terminase small subunit